MNRVKMLVREYADLNVDNIPCSCVYATGPIQYSGHRVDCLVFKYAWRQAKLHIKVERILKREE